MEAKVKRILKQSVKSDDIWDIRHKFDQYELIRDDGYFDYELIKAALVRGKPDIVNFLLKLRCRVRNPNVKSDETPLHLAVQTGNNSIIKKILESGASNYDKNENGETAVQAAFKKELYNGIFVVLNFFCARTLKYLRSRLHPTNEDDVRHFHIACVLNNLNVVEKYLKLGFDANKPLSLNLTEFAGLNPLQYSIKKRNVDLFELLLRYNGDLTVKDVNGLTPLHVMFYSDLCGSLMFRKVFIFGNDTKFDNCTDAHGVSHFHLCCTLNYPDMVQIFIDRGVNVNSAVSFNCPKYAGFTPLHFAVKYNCTEVIELLLKHNADCGKADKNGATPLHLACEKTVAEDNKIVPLLLNFNACPAVVNEKGLTPLHMVFYKANDLRDNIIDLLISRIPRGVNVTDDQGLSYFHIACTRGDASRVTDFLESGVAVDSCVASGLYSGYTALHFAVLCIRKEIVEVLLQRNANVNAKTSEFQLTPLHIACTFFIKYRAMEVRREYVPFILDVRSRGRVELEIVKLLLAHGADANAQDSLGVTPLIQTCTIEKIYFLKDRPSVVRIFVSECSPILREMIETLLSNKANINVRMNNGESILHAVLHLSDLMGCTNLDLIAFFIRQGADVNVVNVDGVTPLHMAVKSSYEKVVNLLARNRANVNARTKESVTPLEMAIENFELYSTEPARVVLCSLLQFGANVNALNKAGHTFLQEAIKNRSIYVIKKLLRHGADVNMKDSSDDVCVSPLIEWSKEAINEELFSQPDYGEVVETIFTHVQKLLALGLYVSKKVQKCCIKMLHHFETFTGLFDGLRIVGMPKIDYKSLEGVFNECVKELETMKLEKINNCSSLYDLLKDKQSWTKYVNNKQLISIVKEYQKFPLYYFLISTRYFQALIRKNNEAIAKPSLVYISGFILPDLFCDSVLKYLADEDIVNLNIAAAVRKRSETKSSDDDLSDNLKSSLNLESNGSEAQEIMELQQD